MKKTIVQIGVADANDHVWEYVRQNNFNVFAAFVEPNPYSINLIKTKYSNLNDKIISNIAISDKNGYLNIFFDTQYETGNSQHSSVNHYHLLRHGHTPDNIKPIHVLCFTLNFYLTNILGFDKDKVIDNLFIDTEGHDCDILLATNFNELNIKQIQFENAHTEGPFSGTSTDKFKKTNEYLKLNGYNEISHDNGESIYSK